MEVMWQMHHKLNVASIIFHINIHGSLGIPTCTDMNTRKRAKLTSPVLLFGRSTNRMWQLVGEVFVPPLLHCDWMAEYKVTVVSTVFYPK